MAIKKHISLPYRYSEAIASGAPGQHPDIMISYNKVTIRLTTHDARGLTKQDFDLARKISHLTDTKL